MEISQGHYIVANTEKRKMLLRVDRVDGNSFLTTVEKTRHLEPEYVTVTAKDTLAYLGKDPKHGSVHGVEIETWKETFNHDVFGDVFVFHKLEPEHAGRLLRGFDKAGKLLKKHGLHKFLPCTIEVRHPKGKVAGSYRFSGKDHDAKPDTLIIRPDEKQEDFAYVLAHESGHGVWFRLFTSKKGRAAWIRQYQYYVRVSKLSEEDLEEFYLRFLALGNPSDAKGQLSEEDEPIFEEVMDYVKRKHSLSLRDLDTLCDTGSQLRDYFPNTLSLSHKEFEITEYAMKSVDEFFAESFALYLLGKTLPKRVADLMEKSIYAASNAIPR